jgi:2-desacetyl-2-hydroxyethyl bacteriochlorophyllide A dehydrogenase
VEVATVEDPVPGPNDVVVRVEACGICASDLHFILGEMPLPVPPPVTMGHEASGTIAAVGSEVPVWREGDRVALLAGKGCHRCDRCAVGLFDECRLPLVLGVHYDGAWAEYVEVPWYGLVRVPDGVSFEHAAIACDSVSTPFAALADRGALRAGDRVALWGIGGLGTHAVQLARLMGASFVAAIDPLPQARERALALGADVALDPGEDVPRLLRADGRGVDLALDLVGSAGAIEQALSSLRRGGRLVVVGQSLQTLTAGPILLLSYLERSILGHLGYRKQDLERVLDLVAAGRLDLSASISGRLPLEAVNEGIERLRTKAASTVRLLVMPWANA